MRHTIRRAHARSPHVTVRLLAAVLASAWANGAFCSAVRAESATQPAAPALLPHGAIHSEFEIRNGYRSTCEVSPSGQVTYTGPRSYGDGQYEARGQLTDAQIKELATAFEGWEQLERSYPNKPGDLRRERITYHGHTVEAGPTAEAPQVFRRASLALRRLAVRQAERDDLPMAAVEDIEVGVTRLGEGEKATILAYVRNKSRRPIRVYVPAFVGPNFSPNVDGAASSVLETYRHGSYGPGDFVVLCPDEAFARTSGIGANSLISAHYVVYVPGHEGERQEPGSQVAIVYPDRVQHVNDAAR